MAEAGNSVLKILKGSVKSYTKNLNLSLPFIFLILITIASVQIFTFITGGPDQNLQTNPENSPFVLFISFVFTLVILYSYSYLISGAIGMSIEIANKKRPSLQTIIKNGKKFWFRTLGATLILLVVTLIPFFIFVAIANPIVGNASIFSKTVVIFFIIFLMLLILSFFILTPYFIIMKNMKVFAGVKKSINFAKKSYGNILLILVIFTTAGILIGLIPGAEQVGNIVSLLIIAPIQTLAFIFYMLSKEK